jgi:hypothetical protein
MPGRDEHLLSAGRFEAFAAHINTPGQPYREWVVIAWFHIALHYVDAFLAQQGHAQIAGHSDRWAKMSAQAETREITVPFERLYKEAKEARYEGGQYTPLELDAVRPLYDLVRGRMRAALGLA